MMIIPEGTPLIRHEDGTASAGEVDLELLERLLDKVYDVRKNSGSNRKLVAAKRELQSAVNWYLPAMLRDLRAYRENLEAKE